MKELDYEFKYLGDGIYAMFGGYKIVLITGTPNDPAEKIYLDPDVFAALVEFGKSKFDESTSS